MTEFDKLAFAERLVELYAERGINRSVEGVLQKAKKIASERGWSLEDTLESIEDRLLSNNPKPENWESGGGDD